METVRLLNTAHVLKTVEFDAMPEAIEQGIARAQELVRRNPNSGLNNGRSS
jgi:hypothetical protein